MAKKKTKAERIERRKRVFGLLDKLVIGAVKIWLGGSPYIVMVEDVDAFIKEKISEIGDK